MTFATEPIFSKKEPRRPSEPSRGIGEVSGVLFLVTFVLLVVLGGGGLVVWGVISAKAKEARGFHADWTQEKRVWLKSENIVVNDIRRRFERCVKVRGAVSWFFESWFDWGVQVDS